MKKYFSLILIAFCSVAAVMAQQQEPVAFRFRHDVPVATQAGQLAAPWSGGLNTPQFSTIDLNQDGQDDLFVFDRQLKKVYTWLAVQQNGEWQYQYAPAYEAFFPADLEYWVLLRDYNCDGLKDIFTSSPLGIRVFKQEPPTGGQLKFTLAGEALFYRDNRVNMQMKSTDIPAIVDIDNDGDLDVLLAEFSRGYTLELYQNMQAEQGLACGTLTYEQQTNWWGGITECDGCNSYLFGAHCRVAAPQHSGHDGSSLLLLDMDADGDKELVMGGVMCDNLVLMENEGSAADALMTGFTPAFPAAKPASFPIFPAAYYEDVTFDGVPDMLVAPQATDELMDINFETSSWLYRNQGAANQPDFTFVQDDFLQGQMIDVGEGAFPAFADMDADGDLDMLVGNSTAYRNGHYSAALHFYRNTGTATAPAFELVTNDYLDLQSQQIFNIKPAFADMNGDGAADLVLTFRGPQANSPRIAFIPNKAPRGQAALYSFADLQAVQAVPGSASPAFADVDKDGDLDLLLGKSDGSLSFYLNTGNAASPVYASEQKNFAGIAADFSRRFLYPAIADVDGDGTQDLLTTDESGELRVYRNLALALQGNTLTAETELLENDLLEGAQATRLGKGLSITAAPLGGENKLYLTIGTQGGGLYLLEQSAGNSVEPTAPEAGLQVAVYPNPTDRSTRETVRAQASEPVTVQVYDAIGKLLYRSRGSYSVNHVLPLQNLKSGLYIIRATSESGKRTSSKFVVR
ncbi:T9SS C-terminal target domain-containing protein [Pontibacter diazotrophicus]|uniref:T9SS C-terminal target domain-containing protein n=1 Tax=Pontibacter diazotrophicus TaxID=1400979 RepID=A0A3D8LDR1_9BACT|nr:T9SS type A sorting domain-containing protein [Pontibacter diazotrophicus]RDV15530.1 T9SS C-terminal target domain-containing protein [Pontibacter diazotrophicus]